MERLSRAGSILKKGFERLLPNIPFNPDRRRFLTGQCGKIDGDVVLGCAVIGVLGSIAGGLIVTLILSEPERQASLKKKEEERQKELEEIKGYLYEIRVPQLVQIPGRWEFPPMQGARLVPGYIATYDKVFLTSVEPKEEAQDGQKSLILTDAVRYDPSGNRILERLTRYQIVNPVNVSVNERFPQTKNP